MTKLIGSILIFMGASAVLVAQDSGLQVPEIHATSGVTALGLLSGGLLVLRARRRP